MRTVHKPHREKVRRNLSAKQLGSAAARREKSVGKNTITAFCASCAAGRLISVGVADHDKVEALDRENRPARKAMRSLADVG